MAKITKELFGVTKKGENVYNFILENKGGTRLEIISLGAAIKSFVIPTKKGNIDLVLGYDTVESYEKQDKYMGAIVGRFANRIQGGRFLLKGKEYSLFCNNGKNHLHGGKEGFNTKVWAAEVEDDKLCMIYRSPAGEEGYPGEVLTRVCYNLTEDNQIAIEINAQGTEDTIINITNHSYFNLAGHNSGTVLGQTMEIFATQFTQNDEESVPTGVILPLKGTALDFSVPLAIGDRITAEDMHIKIGNGYDHNYVLGDKPQNMLKLSARAFSMETQVYMELYTTQPGLQFYSGNYLDGVVEGKKGANYGKHSGFCLEAQGFPNAINCKHFPSPVLKKGELYSQEIVYKFKT